MKLVHTESNLSVIADNHEFSLLELVTLGKTNQTSAMIAIYDYDLEHDCENEQLVDCFNCDDLVFNIGSVPYGIYDLNQLTDHRLESISYDLDCIRQSIENYLKTKVYEKPESLDSILNTEHFQKVVSDFNEFLNEFSSTTTE